MNTNQEYQQIISDINAILARIDELSPQQIGTNIVNSLTPSHYETIESIYNKYPELSELEDLCGDIEILSDSELSPENLTEIICLFEEIKSKYKK